MKTPDILAQYGEIVSLINAHRRALDELERARVAVLNRLPEIAVALVDLDLNEVYCQVRAAAISVCGITLPEFLENLQCRKPKYVDCRSIITGILVNNFNVSTGKLAILMGKDRTTLIHAAAKSKQYTVFDREYRAKFDATVTEVLKLKAA